MKENIVTALKVYADENGLSQGQLEQATGVNISYINALLNRDFSIGKTLIGDSHFKKIAKAINFQVERVFWKHEDTPQYLQLYAELMDAKVSGRVRVLAGKTRHGKTYTVDRFVKKAPKETYRITVSSLYNLKDIINEICHLLGLDASGSKVSRLKRIAKSLNDKKMKGGQPILIIDEAENMTVPVLRMFKALYDVIKDSCSIAFVGTPEFVSKLEQMKGKTEGLEQFYCRVKAGIRWIKDINRRTDFESFLDLVEDRDLRVLLGNIADNYGELNDYLEYSLQEADRMGQPLTERLFRNLNNI